MNNEFPVACYEDIVVQEIKDEVLVCDTKSNRVFCLNETAGEVWKLCDGEKSIREISAILSKKMRSDVSEEMVLFSLAELSRENLLAEKFSADNLYGGISRREVIKKIGLGSIVALPLITAIIMPTAAHAQSGCPAIDPFPNGCACNSSFECDSSCCLGTICATRDDFLCGGGVDCPAPYICCNDPNSGNVDDFNCSCDGLC